MTFARSKAQMKIRLLMDNVSPAHNTNRINGKNKITSPSWSSHRPMGMVPTTQNSNRGAVSSRGLEHKDRQRVQSHTRSSRLEIRPFRVCRVVGACRGGSVSITPVNPASSLLQLETRLIGRSCRCFLPRLELDKGIRIPPFCTHLQVPRKNPRSAGYLSSSSGASVASSALVPFTLRCCVWPLHLSFPSIRAWKHVWGKYTPSQTFS